MGILCDPGLGKDRMEQTLSTERMALSQLNCLLTLPSHSLGKELPHTCLTNDWKPEHRTFYNAIISNPIKTVKRLQPILHGRPSNGHGTHGQSSNTLTYMRERQHVNHSGTPQHTH